MPYHKPIIQYTTIGGIWPATGAVMWENTMTTEEAGFDPEKSLKAHFRLEVLMRYLTQP